MQSHIGCICLTFLHCAFLNVSSNCLPEKRHSHTDYICLAFLHCVFSNVSSNCLLKNRQSHIGCIVLLFSTVHFKNGLPERMQSHIGCIYLTFLHGAFSNAFPNSRENEKLHIFGLFSTRYFQMAWLRRCVVTLVAFVWLFSTVCSQMSPQMWGCKVTLVAIIWLLCTVRLFIFGCIHLAFSSACF